MLAVPPWADRSRWWPRLLPADALDAARQLYRIDPQPHRGAVYLAVTLLQLKQYDEAGNVLEETLQRHGDNGDALTNLAKVYSFKGDEERAKHTLWRALEVDPNQSNGLNWFVARERDRGGEAARLAALRSVAVLPSAWRAQLWLARSELENNHVVAAMAFYRQALSRATPAPTDLLMQMSGDLGNRGQLRELVELTVPHFDAKLHGLTVGNNLIKAYVDLRESAKARAILEQLYAQQRPDWRQALTFWDGELDKAEQNYGPVPTTEELHLDLLRLDVPIWAANMIEIDSLLSAKPTRPIRVGFMAGSAEQQGTDRITVQPADTVGRLTRALPLFLARADTAADRRQCRLSAAVGRPARLCAVWGAMGS